MLSAKQAAEATGVSKQAIIRAIKRGTVSASKDIHGEWQVDASELFRHYQPVAVVHTNGAANDASVYTNGAASDELVHTPDSPSVDSLREKVVLLERIIGDKEEVIRAKDMVIDVLTQENTRQAAVIAQLQPPKAKVGWWQRLLGGG
jgi:hypothetical protein